jgi:hypothetical protein
MTKFDPKKYCLENLEPNGEKIIRFSGTPDIRQVKNALSRRVSKPFLSRSFEIFKIGSFISEKLVQLNHNIDCAEKKSRQNKFNVLIKKNFRVPLRYQNHQKLVKT